MKRLNLISLGTALAASLSIMGNPVRAAGNDQKLEDALIVEWTVANCDEQIPAMTTMFAAMVINGSNAADVARIRSALHRKIADRFEDSQTACVKVSETIKANPPPLAN